MPQVARPNADVANSNWGPTPLYPHVNGVNPNDGSPVFCPVPPGGSFDVQLQPLAATNSTPQTLTVRLDEAQPGDTLVSFFLLKVSPSVILTVAGFSVQATGSFTSYDLTLNAAQIASIGGDYSDLRVRVVASGPGTGSYYGSGSGVPAGGSVTVGCCPNVALPTTLWLTNWTQHGSNYNFPPSIPLTWNPGAAQGPAWESACYSDAGACFTRIKLLCNATAGQLQWLLGEDVTPQLGTPADAGWTCSPVYMHFSGVPMKGTQDPNCGPPTGQPCNFSATLDGTIMQ